MLDCWLPLHGWTFLFDFRWSILELCKYAKGDRRTDRVKFLLDKRDRLLGEIEELDEKQAQKEERLRELMVNAWRGMLSMRLSGPRKNLEDRIQSLKSKELRASVEMEVIRGIRKALSEGRCPTCFREIDEKDVPRLSRLIEQQFPREDNDDPELRDELAKLSQKTLVLERFQADSGIELVQEITNDIDRFIIDKSLKQEEIREINDQIQGLNLAEIRGYSVDYQTVLRDIALLDEGISKERENIEKINKDIDKLDRELKRIRGTNNSKESQKRTLYEMLWELFDAGVDVYRERLRKKVELDATEIFLKLTTEPDYIGLKINDNYGLTILHKDGKLIPIRSAGAEHVVALSLIGALQKNAPLQGPIVMDSPFGRLDEEHKTKVIQSLPTMASQVILLVFEEELKPQVARNELLSNLKLELQLARQTARCTTIEKFLEE